jgi:Tfp pilus assembly protein PilX
MRLAPSIARTGARVRTRGVASLAVTLIMLALAALVILYTNRGQLFEQRTSANQLRATAAFEAADAGIEWALARLNDKTLMLPSPTSTCLASAASGAAKFIDFYLQTSLPNPSNPTAFDFTPVTGNKAACSIDETSGALNCHCPMPPANIVLGSPGRRSFEITYSEFAADPGIVRITSVGCRDAANAAGAPIPCSSTAPTGATNEGTATVTVLVKFVPGAGSVSSSALTAGGYADVCGSYNITNSSPNATGTLVNSGGNTQIGNGVYTSGPLPQGAPNCGGGGGMTLTTLTGTPITAAVAPNDAALAAAAASSDAMMKAYFGMSLADYINDAATCQISGTSATDRANNVLAAYNGPSRCRRFWVDGAAQFSSALLGIAGDPVMLATASDLTLNGNTQIFGIVYSDTDLLWDHNGSGNGTVTGQIVVRGNYYSNGNGSIIFNDTVTSAFVLGSGEFVRVPGSWRDF